MSQLADIINQINQLTGYDLQVIDVEFTSNPDTPTTVVLYAPNAVSGTISTAGIDPGNAIKAEHLLRVIDTFNGVSKTDVIISGSLFAASTSSFSGPLSVPYIEDGKYLYTSGGYVVGLEAAIESASYAATASLAPDYLPLADTASMLVPYVLTNSTASMTVLSSSFAVTASYALNGGTTVNTESFVTTSSFNTFTASFNTGSFTGSFTGNLLGSASWAESASIALTASYALFAVNGGGAEARVSSGSIALFGGLPYTASITLSPSFSNDAYSVGVSSRDARIFTVEAQTSASFVINTNSSVALTGPVYWTATVFNQ